PFGRWAVRAGSQPRLGPLDSSEMLAEVVRQARIELVLVEVGRLIRGVLFVRQLTRVLMAEPGQRTLDARALGGQELPCPLRIHGGDVTGHPHLGAREKMGPPGFEPGTNGL